MRHLPSRQNQNTSHPRRALFLEQLEDRRVLSTFTVINTDDDGPGSLRQAIVDANGNAGHDDIVFNIPGSGVHTIAPLAILPFVSDVSIDATTQPGFSANGPRLIELSGKNFEDLNLWPQDHDYGFELIHNCTIKGFAINEFFAGITVVGSNNHIAGNYIGTDPTGAMASPNNLGINFFGIAGYASADNLIGSDNDGVNDLEERNVISGSLDYGVQFGAENSVVRGNYIGTDATGMHAVPNRVGIWGGGFGGVIRGNLVSGNSDSGIIPAGYDLKIQGNLIGTDVTGNNPLSNHTGIFLHFYYGPVLIGGTTPADRNIISGNNEGITSYSGDHIIQGNYIGPNQAGTAAIGNSIGIRILFDSALQIGGTTTGAGNVISGNGSGDGILFLLANGQNRVEGNLIGVAPNGVTPMGNGGGVAIGDIASNQIIGGTVPGAGNTIAFNGRGIYVLQTVDGQIDHHNRFLGNSIYANDFLGIDLWDRHDGTIFDGVTPNDPQDTDAGANDAQNYPVLTSAASNATTTTVKGTLNSTPNSTFRIEFFSNTTADPSGHGEGETYLGFTNVSTDAAGNATFTATLPSAVGVGKSISSTATDLTEFNTSEFSANVVSVPGNTAPQFTTVGGQECTDTELTLQVAATDPDAGDTLTYSVSYVSKTGPGAVNAPTGFSIDASGRFHWTPGGGQLGQYSFKAKVTDSEGLFAEQAFVVTTLGQVDGVLTIVGTGGVDKIDVKPTDGNPEELTVKVNERDYHYQLKPGHNPDNPYTGVTLIHICGLGGNDQINIHEKVAIGAWLEGGAGNDQLRGGEGHDVIFGGLGDDELFGDDGNDVLVGGLGADKARGEKGHDILISGEIGSDLDFAALLAISQAWTASHTIDEAEDIDAALEETLNDGNCDQLTGGAGSDLFFINAGDTVTDFKFGKPKANKDGDVVIQDGSVIT